MSYAPPANTILWPLCFSRSAGRSASLISIRAFYSKKIPITTYDVVMGSEHKLTVLVDDLGLAVFEMRGYRAVGRRDDVGVHGRVVEAERLRLFGRQF